MARALEYVAKKCDELGIPMPRELICWCDNTTKEPKNAVFLEYLIWLIASHDFGASGMMNLIVGHTHDCQNT